MKSKFKMPLRSEIGTMLKNNRRAVLLELIIVFGLVFIFMKIALPIAKGNQFVQQGITWLANIALIGMVWLTQWLRGAGFRDLGLDLAIGNRRVKLKVFAQSILVFILAILAFVLGSMAMSVFMDETAQTDISSYNT